MRRASLLGWVGVSAALTGCPDFGAVCTDPSCLGDASLDGMVDAPPNCNPAADPKDSLDCVVDSFGIFVDATNGNDSNAGTKAQPVQTIAHALGILAGRSRVYICEGAYAEDVALTATASASLYGGWKCGAWTYSGTKATVGKGAVALKVDSVLSAVTVEDLAATSASASNPGESSVAAWINASSNVTLLRVALTAGSGKDGADPTQKAQAAKAADGISSGGNPGGGACTNTCPDGVSTGGKGGDVGQGNAQDGVPSYGGTYPNNGGHGIDSTNCTSGGGGGTGVIGPVGPDQPGATTYGALTAAAWAPSAGTAATFGARGQGGGGGGARAGGGGGGGCGGCGGSGGDPGGGGGGSFGLVSIGSTVTMNGSSIMTAAAGRGGTGGKGQLGQPPGAGAGGYTGSSPNGCSGGDGALGGSGGNGGGGTGGLSVGVFFKTTPPTLDSATQAAITTGAKGTKGTGGTPSANDGIDGVAQATLECKAPLCQ